MLAAVAALTAFNNGLARAASWASGTLVASIALIVAAGVFWRYVLNDSLSWTEEVARYLLIWLAAVGSVVAMHRGQLVAIDLLPEALPPAPARLLRAAIALVIVATSAIMAVYGWRLALNAWGQEATAIAMPLFFVTAAIPFACACFTLLALEQGLKTLLADGRRPENRS